MTSETHEVDCNRGAGHSGPCDHAPGCKRRPGHPGACDATLTGYYADAAEKYKPVQVGTYETRDSVVILLHRDGRTSLRSVQTIPGDVVLWVDGELLLGEAFKSSESDDVHDPAVTPRRFRIVHRGVTGARARHVYEEC